MKNFGFSLGAPAAFGLMLFALTLAVPASAQAADLQTIGDWPELATMEAALPLAVIALEECAEAVTRTAPVVRSATSPPTPVAHPCLHAWEAARAVSDNFGYGAWPCTSAIGVAIAICVGTGVLL